MQHPPETAPVCRRNMNTIRRNSISRHTGRLEWVCLEAYGTLSRFKIRQLTDVLQCKLQHDFLCNQH
jgi:hypothetical protein